MAEWDMQDAPAPAPAPAPDDLENAGDQWGADEPSAAAPEPAAANDADVMDWDDVPSAPPQPAASGDNVIGLPLPDLVMQPAATAEEFMAAFAPPPAGFNSANTGAPVFGGDYNTNSRPLQATGCSNLFVGNLSWKIDEGGLRSHFGQCGAVTSARVVTDPDTGRSKGFGYVDFANSADAAKAMAEMNGATLDGRDIKVDFSTPGAKPARSGGGGGGGRGGGFSAARNPESATLFVGGCHGATQEMLRDAFSAHGTILDIRIPIDRESGIAKGFAYVDFASVDEARAAFEQVNGADIGGRNVGLDYAVERGSGGGRGDGPSTAPTSPPAPKIFIGRVSAQVTEEDLRNVFGAHGEITDVYLAIDQDTQASRGFAYLTFSTLEAAITAVTALNGTEIGGQKINLDYAKVKERPLREVEAPQNPPTIKIMIRGISDDTTEELLRETFGVHGEINDIYMPTNQETGEKRGFAFLSFSSVDEAILAVDALNGSQLEGRQIRLDFAEIREHAPREVEAPQNPPTVKIMIRGLSDDATENIIREGFGVHGDIVDIFIPKDPETDAPRGFGFVSFSSVDEAVAAAEALNGAQMAGRQLAIDFAETRDGPPRVPTESRMNGPTDTLFVGNTSKEVTVEQIRAAFLIHAVVIDVMIPVDTVTNESKGFSYVSFKSIDDATKALEAMNGQEICGQQVRLDYANVTLGPRIPDSAPGFDPNEAVYARNREFNTHIAAEINVPDRFELFLLGDGEKKITEQIDTRTPNSSIFTILKEDHTLCNLLRAHLLKDPAVLFAGYKIPHPLFAKVELRVQTDGSITPKDAVISCSKKLVSDLGQFSREFTKEFELRKMVANASAAPQVQGGQN